MQAILILAACAAVASPAAARPNIFGQLTSSYTKYGGRGILDSLPNLIGNKDLSSSISASLTKETGNDGRSGALKVSLENNLKSQDYSNIASPVDYIPSNIDPSDYYSKGGDVVSDIVPRDYSPSSINREVNDKHSELSLTLEKNLKSQDYSNIASPVDYIPSNIDPSDYYSKSGDVVSDIVPRDYSPSSINREVNDKQSELSLTLEKNLKSQDYSKIASPVDNIPRNIDPSDYYSKADDVVSNIVPRDYSPSSINREVNDKHRELSLTLEKNLKSQDYSNIASPVDNIPRNIDPSDYYSKAGDVVSNIVPRDYSPSSINREVNDKSSELSLTLEKNLKSQDYSNIASPVDNIPRNIDPSDYYSKADDVVSNIAPRDYYPSPANRAGNDGRSDRFFDSDEESWQGDARLDAQLEHRKW